MSNLKKPGYTLIVGILATVLFTFGIIGMAHAAPPVNAPIIGEIERITVNNITNHWSKGEIVVGGQTIIIPNNLLIDLPANRLTLQELFLQAPAACLATGETGLAKADICNTSGVGGIATVTANRTSRNNVIAADVFIQKGIEAVTGVVTYIDHTDGYFVLNGILNDPATGVMVRLNDPTARHTIQQGLGCATAGPAEPNCSPDPRFTLDPDNYVNAFITGYPFCIPSTVARPFPGLPAIQGVAALPPGTAVSDANGIGDLLCPSTNRRPNLVTEPPAADSRRFAPLKLGDSLTAEGNFETINGVRFLSAHTTLVAKALMTKNQPGQPDYIFLDEVEVDAPGFQNQRVRALFIGFATLDTDVLIWSRHFDPINNEPHEFPLASVRGCDAAGGAGTCGGQGLVGQGNLIWKIRYDIDFLAAANKKPELNPCAVINGDPGRRLGTVCGGANASVANQFRILSPISREIQARTGHSLANPGLITLDVKGEVATNGQYIFPFGVGLGGVSFPEMVEIDLNALNTPFSFSGIPWMMDRRLSPGGCFGPCEPGPKPLNPFPFEEIDPCTQVPNLPAGGCSRILGFFPFGAGDVLAWPPAIPPHFAIAPTPPLVFACGTATTSTVSGRVTRGSSALAVGGVTMTLADAVGTPVATTLTDFAGSYLFAGVANGSYTITPSKGTLIFSPTFLPVNVIAAGTVTGQYFTTVLAQTITFGALVDKVLADPPFTVSATASSGLAVTFTSTTPSVCSVAGDTVTLVSTGVCTIRASQAGDADYAPAPDVDQSFTVNP